MTCVCSALVPDACKQQPKRGRGGSRYDTWYYDVITDDCRWMAARSRFGNANRFVSRAACLAHCKYQINDPCEVSTISKFMEFYFHSSNYFATLIGDIFQDFSFSAIFGTSATNSL